jgi:hypothetical protein
MPKRQNPHQARLWNNKGEIEPKNDRREIEPKNDRREIEPKND